MRKNVLFLSWESPWPAYSGASLRALGLLRELSRTYSVYLLMLTRMPLTVDQESVLGQYAVEITRIPLRDVTYQDKARVALGMVQQTYPYHSSLLQLSMLNHPDLISKIRNFHGIVFTSVGHWGTLVHKFRAPNWILNQCDADVEFWRVYAGQATEPIARLAARVNYKLAHMLFPQIYSNVGRIISVCEEDRMHTLALSPRSQVDVIENGVDCSYYAPNREELLEPPRLLFTGTSAPRNITALSAFTKDILPLIHVNMPEVELLIGGNFTSASQQRFASVPNIRFTGRVHDMRPVFDQSTVFIAPFKETHGSKLKIAEAMAMGMPIVSTPEGIRGFALVNNQSALVARDDDEFSAHCLTLLRCPQRRATLGQAAREVALATIDWQVLGAKLNRITEKMFSDLKQIDRGSTIA